MYLRETDRKRYTGPSHLEAGLAATASLWLTGPMPKSPQNLLRRAALLFAALTFAFSIPNGRAQNQADASPNILFIFADDLAFDALGSYGLYDIETPNLDRLAARGTTFTHAYNQGAWGGAVCVASRMMLNTGRSLWKAWADYNQTDELYRKEGRLWSQLMKKQGYRTYFTGKWHVKADAAAAFDVASNVRGGMPNQTPEGYNRPIEGQPDVWSPYDPKFEGFWKGGKHWSEVVADDAEGFIQDASERDEPFFMYIAFNAPHDPRQAPKEFVDKYPPESVKVPENFLSEYPYQIGSNKVRDEVLAPFPRTPYAVQVNRGEYYALITHMDVQIGRILDALEASGMSDSTYIAFSADHGLAVGQHGLLGKQNMYDHSVRVPFFMVGPGIEAGKKIDSPIYLQDIMPTTLDIAGAPIPEEVDFQSLMPMLEGRGSRYDSIYSAYTEHQRMVVKDGFKLIYYPKIAQSRLYHVSQDPLEMNDLIPESPLGPNAVAKNLAQELRAWGRRLGDDVDYNDWELLQ